MHTKLKSAHSMCEIWMGLYSYRIEVWSAKMYLDSRYTRNLPLQKYIELQYSIVIVVCCWSLLRCRFTPQPTRMYIGIYNVCVCFSGTAHSVWNKQRKRLGAWITLFLWQNHTLVAYDSLFTRGFFSHSPVRICWKALVALHVLWLLGTIHNT